MDTWVCVGGGGVEQYGRHGCVSGGPHKQGACMYSCSVALCKTALKSRKRGSCCLCAVPLPAFGLHVFDTVMGDACTNEVFAVGASPYWAFFVLESANRVVLSPWYKTTILGDSGLVQPTGTNVWAARFVCLHGPR